MTVKTLGTRTLLSECPSQTEGMFMVNPVSHHRLGQGHPATRGMLPNCVSGHRGNAGCQPPGKIQRNCKAAHPKAVSAMVIHNDH